MKKTPSRRCSECTRVFVPNPRVGDRQATCGDQECQRRRHAKACRRWRAKNRGVTASHYKDVVKPYRWRHPGYQRRWRVARRVGEIREEIAAVAERVGKQLRSVLSRGRLAYAEAGREPSHVQATTGKSLVVALAAGSLIAGVVDELAAVLAGLEAVAERGDEARYESR